MNHKHILESLTACEEAIRWYNDKDSKEAWASCERGEWLLWIAAELSVDRKLIVLAACDCAEQSLYLIPEEERPKMAIETARAWTRGEVSLGELETAYVAANAVANAAAAVANAAAAAAYSAASAASADDAAAYSAAAAAAYSAASAAASADDAAAYSAASAAASADYAAAASAAAGADYAAARAADYNIREERLKKSAELVRSRISWELIEEKLS